MLNGIFVALPLLYSVSTEALRRELDRSPWTPGVSQVTPGTPAPKAPPAVRTPTTPVAPTAASPTIAVVPKPIAPKRDTVQPKTVPAVVAPSASANKNVVWGLQVAAVASEEKALEEKKRIEQALGKNSVTIIQAGKFYKLRWGTFASREEANAARPQLEPLKLDGFPVQSPKAP